MTPRTPTKRFKIEDLGFAIVVHGDEEAWVREVCRRIHVASDEPLLSMSSFDIDDESKWWLQHRVEGLKNAVVLIKLNYLNVCCRDRQKDIVLEQSKFKAIVEDSNRKAKGWCDFK